MNNLYQWVSSLLGIPSQGSNSTVVYIAGSVLLMTYIVCLDLLINGIFRFFKR